jgi:hypothetical protein
LIGVVVLRAASISRATGVTPSASWSRTTTLSHAECGDDQRGSEAAGTAPECCPHGELPVSPRLTFAEVAEQWLADFEVKVAAGERRERTFDPYRSQ